MIKINIEKIICRTKRWLGSAAGKISLILIVLSMVILALACSSWGNLSVKAANNINNILFGIGTNLLGIIVTVSFVQYFIDKQSEQIDKRAEIDKIKRYDRFAEVLINRYLMYYNCVTSPMGKRHDQDPLQMKNIFPFEDMCDMYKQSLYMCEGVFEPSIVLLYKAEEKLSSYMIQMLENIEFKYNEPLKNILMNFVEICVEYDVRGAVLGNMDVTLAGSGKKMTEEIEMSIKDPSYSWVEKAKNGELNSNVILPYVRLYSLLIMEMNLLIQYKEYLKNMA